MAAVPSLKGVAPEMNSNNDAVPVRSVTGTLSSSDLGFTLPHEHLINSIAAGGLSPDTEFPDLFKRKVQPELSWLLNERPYSCRDNCSLDDIDDSAAELTAFCQYGGRTVVEVTPEGQGRDLASLAALSKRTGVNIVAGGGWYLERSLYPAEASDHADPRPGVIGEIGVSPQFTAQERKVLRAACIVQRERHLPLYIHLPGFLRYGNLVLDIVLGEQGVAPGAVVLCHMDPSGSDPSYQLSLAERGVWLEFDMIGMPYRFTLPGEGRSPSPGQTLEAVSRLVYAGFASSLLFSHDLFLKSMLRKNGGNGLVYIPALFLRLLEERNLPGFDPGSVNTLNVAKLFESAAGRSPENELPHPPTQRRGSGRSGR